MSRDFTLDDFICPTCQNDDLGRMDFSGKSVLPHKCEKCDTIFIWKRLTDWGEYKAVDVYKWRFPKKEAVELAEGKE